MGSRLDVNSATVRKRIANHTFDNEEGEEYGSSKFGGFTDYFRRKKIKLQNRDAEQRSLTTDNPPIFRGVVAHVNGYTQPSLNDLHSLIVGYGGGFMQYLDGKTTVTHIIAANLTPKKKVEFKRYRIVKPAWVVDSIRAGKLLPWDAYRVVDEGTGQHVLGFDNGNIVSQLNNNHTGYKDQTDESWYTDQVRKAAKDLDLLPSNRERPFDRDSTDPCIEPRASTFPEYDVGSTGDAVGLWTDGKFFERDGSRDREESVQTPLNAQRSPNTPLESEVSEDSAKPLGDANKYSPNNSTVDSRQASSKTAEEHNADLLSNPRVWKSTVVNPGFLKQYYEESRLHHLSAWKAELKSQLQALAVQKSYSQKSQQKQSPGFRRYILHVDFDSFFAAVSLLKYPQYVDKPAVVAHGGGSGSEIASCNYPARHFGIKNGMWMKTAQQLCPDLKILPYDFKAYEDASRSFYNAIIDTGGIVQSVSVDEALLDVSAECNAAGDHEGKGVHQGSIWAEQARADSIAQGLRDLIKGRTGCAVSVGIGGNVLLAKVALRKAKPAGQYQIKSEEILSFIGNLTVQDLPGVAYSIGGKLDEIGVKFVKDVRELTKEKLIMTLGPKTGGKIWDYSHGIDRSEVGEQVIRKSVSAEVNWGIRFVTQHQADEFVQSLCEELHKRLTNERVRGRQLTLKVMRRAPDAPLDPPKHLGHGKCDTFNKSQVLGVATNSKEILAKEAISLLRGFGFSPGELRGIGIQMTKLEPLKGSPDNSLKSSQKRLHFKACSPNREAKLGEGFIVNEGEPPRKPSTDASPLHSKPTKMSPAVSEPRKHLNTLGTQFVLPSHVDPEILGELPEDIKARLLPNAAPGVGATCQDMKFSAPSSSPPVVPPNLVPSQSQLDQEALDALPDDIRAEILSIYRQSPTKSHGQSVLPQSPRKTRSVIMASKKPLTPSKKRSGLFFRSKQSANPKSGSTLTQSNFIATHAKPPKFEAQPDSTAGSEAEEASTEFLSALPEDIRKEVLAQQRRDRLQRRGGIDLASKKKSHRPAGDVLPVGQRQLRLSQPPPKPTFTAKNLSSLPEVRDAISSWHEEFLDEGPFEEDVHALTNYLQKVVEDEKDMEKAINIVHWLSWLVDHGDGTEGGRSSWHEALQGVQFSVQDALGRREVGSVIF